MRRPLSARFCLPKAEARRRAPAPLSSATVCRHLACPLGMFSRLLRAAYCPQNATLRQPPAHEYSGRRRSRDRVKKPQGALLAVERTEQNTEHIGPRCCTRRYADLSARSRGTRAVPLLSPPLGSPAAGQSRVHATGVDLRRSRVSCARLPRRAYRRALSVRGNNTYALSLTIATLSHVSRVFLVLPPIVLRNAEVGKRVKIWL